VRTTPRTPPKEKEKRERITITSVEIIKSVDEECVKLCEESMHLWTTLTEDLTMKAVEERLRNAQDKAQKATWNISMLPPSEHIKTVLVRKKSYNEIEQLREEKKTLGQQLVPL
jgi:hypothetical protein